MSAYKTVYKVQCKTAAVLSDLWKLPENLATTPDHPIMLFRVVPAHRCTKSLQIRKMVADKVRAMRKQGEVTP
jgi:hypothetical protein